ncbi:hypothetical protein V0288_08405 [Pannus brasiliensis CCIBt3594]|uniref:Uncharacterized protein n=1 Tax=Pannus brasiliensis CCIBt3594 TaxID=1427578 RepID=A0AAW9QT29_9CHRO
MANNWLALGDIAAGLARDLVDAQFALDRHAEERAIVADEEGIPPSAFRWSRFGCSLAASYRVRPKQTHAETTRLSLAPASRDLARLRLTFRYAPPAREDGENGNS